ncbi:MAG TPA: hypothetical protein VII02_00810 [Gemmatimonadaceae bacterium]
MKHLARLTISFAVTLSLIAGAAKAQGDDLAIDFRLTESGVSGGSPVNGDGTGHAVISKDRVRIDMKGNTRMMKMPGGGESDSVTLIMVDSGKTLIFLYRKDKRFLRIRPAEMMEGMQKLMEGIGASMSFDITGDDPKVENLGAGPVILGHHTLRYRVTGGMTVSVTAMGQSQVTRMSSVADEYLASDFANFTDPFRGLGQNAMGAAFGPGARAYFDKMQAARSKFPGLALRAETHVITSGAGRGSDIKSVSEVTGIQKTTASPSLFEVPADYTPMTLPSMQRARDTIPPSKH